MKLFDIIGGKVVIHSDALGIPCFKKGEERRKNRVEENEVIFFLLSFSDLSHHRTCRSAYGGSYFGHHLR